jgi:hypothetical protein
VIFEDGVGEAQRCELLDSLSELQASYEGATGRCFAIDVEPEGDYAEVRKRLDVWEAQGFLDYETCEARVAGSFDEEP